VQSQVETSLVFGYEPRILFEELGVPRSSESSIGSSVVGAQAPTCATVDAILRLFEDGMLKFTIMMSRSGESRG
jgi:hypothetical protein